MCACPEVLRTQHLPMRAVALTGPLAVLHQSGFPQGAGDDFLCQCYLEIKNLALFFLIFWYSFGRLTESR